MVSFTLKVTSEGFAIKFEWSDGRTSFDFKDQAGKLLKDKSYSVRGTGSDCTKSKKIKSKLNVVVAAGQRVVLDKKQIQLK